MTVDRDVFIRQFGQVQELAQANERIAIHACLLDIYLAGMDAQPKVIMELGVSKEALANKVLALVAEAYGSRFISCDIGDFRDACGYHAWYFFQEDDIALARQFATIGAGIGLMDIKIDLLLIDTDEKYDHVKQEIEAWFPFLSPHATVIFRCTNLKKRLYYPDGRETGLGWDNERGVIRALEDFFGCGFTETHEFTNIKRGWLIRHKPWGAGLTVMRRL